MVILGIDPGLVTTGYGLIKSDGSAIRLLEAGIIKTSPNSKIEKRLFKIYSGLTGILNEFKVDVIVLEKIYSHYRHPVTALLMGHARGIVCLVAGGKNIPLFNYPSTRIKKAITGRGRASKEQVSGMVRHYLNIRSVTKPYDVTDALALAIAHSFIRENK